MSKTIIVTGGTGYIGSHTTVELIEAGYDVVAIDNLSNSTADVLAGIARITGRRPTFYEADCNDREAMDCIFAQHAPVSGIIHFAASKAVGESVHKTLLYSGNTKQINEEIIRDTIHADAPFRAILLRYFNPIGAHPSAEIGERPAGTPQNLVPYLTQTAAGIRPELRVFGDDYDTPDGSCIRDYIDIVDLARAHVEAVRRLVEGQATEPLEVFNLGTGRGVSVLELIRTFEEATGVRVPYQIVGRREGDIEQVWADPTRANRVLGWTARTPLSDTLRNAWKWQQRQE